MEDSLEMEVYHLLKSTQRKVRKDLHDKLADDGVTWPQFHALCHIGDEGLTFTELAKELHCNTSNITGIIDRMIENDWVYREHSEVDRRVWLVRLTDEGNRLKARLLPGYSKNIKERMNILDKEQLMTLKSLLEKLSIGHKEGE